MGAFMKSHPPFASPRTSPCGLPHHGTAAVQLLSRAFLHLMSLRLVSWRFPCRTIHYWINNAGINGGRRAFMDLPTTTIEAVAKVNLVGTLLCTQVTPPAPYLA